MPNFGTVRPLVFANSPYACVANDEILKCNATAGVIAVTLPTLNLFDGRKITILKTDASVNAITWAAPGGYTIESILADASVNKKDDQQTMVLVGTIWYGASEAETVVKLQAATPGTVQTGNISISGTVIATTATASASLTATTGNITADIGNIMATLGSVSAGTDVTAGIGVTATAGDVTATAGDVVATAGDVVATAGDVIATAGDVIATAGDVVATAGDVIATAGDVIATAGVFKVGANQVVGAQAAVVADVVAAGVTTPANAVYQVADQTADADAIIEIKAQLNSLLAKLRTHGLIAT